MLVLPRVYPILDTSALAARGCDVQDAAEALLEAGMRILQFRHKGPFTRAIFRDAECVAKLCRDAGALFIVDDRADIALLLDAGVHVGQDDLSPTDVRRVLQPDAVVGYSTHNDDQLCAAKREPVDYVALGPIFGTASKDRPDPVVGLDGLRRWRVLTQRPLVAIGGIVEENAAQVFAAGADAVAVIAALLPDPCSRSAIRHRAEVLLACTK